MNEYQNNEQNSGGRQQNDTHYTHGAHGYANANAYQHPSSYLPNGVLNFFLSLIPGAGHMYQGLLRRGVLMMALFAGSIVLAVICDNYMFGLGGILMGLFITAMIIVYFFSFFDSLRTCRLIRSGAWTGEREKDVLLDMPSIRFDQGGLKAAGIVLVIIGALGLFSYCVDAFIPQEWFWQYVRPALEVLVPLAFLVAGIVLIGKSARGKREKERV